MKTFFDLIKDKESNHAHSKEEIDFIINSYTSGEIKDETMTSWLKAVCLNGMKFSETVNYTDSIINSGERIYFDDYDGYVIDKHSTGGVGDKVSLILGPILAACGCYVPMIVGRALGHTGGTLVKLESIKNYNGLIGLNRFKFCNTLRYRSINCYSLSTHCTRIGCRFNITTRNNLIIIS